MIKNKEHKYFNLNNTHMGNISSIYLNVKHNYYYFNLIYSLNILLGYLYYQKNKLDNLMMKGIIHKFFMVISHFYIDLIHNLKYINLNKYIY